MPFAKGRVKTGGRTKGGPKKKSSRLIDQLKDHGFHFVRELAEALKGPNFTRTPKYEELMRLLPYMAPKLKEKQVELTDPTQAPPTEAPISDEELLRSLENEPETKSRTSQKRPVAPRNPELPAPAGAEVDLPDVAGEQDQD